MLAKRTYKNQVTLPKEIVKDFPGVDYFDVSAEGGRIVLRPVTVSPTDDALDVVRNKIRALGLAERDIQDAVRWARRKT
ncbi:MAG: AbrB/MazE/SpoVT family DNA-binding domain-containing protein [Elusimicrobiota bacterium]